MMSRFGQLSFTTYLMLVLPVINGGRIAAAQTSDALEQCASIASETQRLACYDDLLRPAAPESTPEPPAPPAETTRPSAAESSAVAEPAADAPPPPAAATRAPAPREANAERPAEVAEPEPRRERRFRLRRNREANRDEEDVVVVEVRTSISDLRIFTIEDGRVFTQTSTDTVRHDDPPFDARLEPASFGSYFLIPEGSARGVRVSLQE